MTTIHVLSNPFNYTSLDNRIEPFACATWKFIHYLKDRYNFVHYGIPGAKVECEHVDCPKTSQDDFNRVAGEEIRRRKKPGDLIVCFYGKGNQIAAEMNNDLKIIEPSIGYRTSGVFAPYRVFTSYAHMHMFYGERDMLMNPSWFDDVIPNGFTPEEFEYREEKYDYFLYLGRIIEEKGVSLAIQATAATGKKLIIAGPQTDLKHLGYDKVPDHVEMFGYASVEQRRELLAGAKALLGLTYYVEPFGNMVVEAQFSGTPSIVTDWGGFTETVIPGFTGARVRDFNELCEAIKNIDKIDPYVCRQNAMDKYTDEIVHNQFDNYLKKVSRNEFYWREFLP